MGEGDREYPKSEQPSLAAGLPEMGPEMGLKLPLETDPEKEFNLEKYWSVFTVRVQIN